MVSVVSSSPMGGWGNFIFVRHLDANFVQKWRKCQICVIYENLEYIRQERVFPFWLVDSYWQEIPFEIILWYYAYDMFIYFPWLDNIMCLKSRPLIFGEMDDVWPHQCRNFSSGQMKHTSNISFCSKENFYLNTEEITQFLFKGIKRIVIYCKFFQLILR